MSERTPVSAAPEPEAPVPVGAISVTALCNFAARSGSLQHRYTPAPSAEEGIAGHRLLQKRRPPEYKPEYSLSGEFSGLAVRGRVDGYCALQNTTWLEEIKTHNGEEGRRESARNTLHWAQLKVYGALLCQQEQHHEVTLRLTYFDLFNELEHSEDRLYSATELRRFTEALCLKFRAWADQEARHRQERDQALTRLQFPFDDFRSGQRELAELCFKAISTQRSLMLQAPTGLGKTLGVLYPSLLAMPRENLDRLFYLSSRNTGKQLALDAIALLRSSQNLSCRIVELVAREHACEHPDLACHGESCPLARGFFDRLPKARQDAADQAILDQARLKEIAQRHAICPYFLGQEMARWSDVIVADVNHFFDRQALLQALAKENDWQLISLIDEAHNLIDRARSMYSADLQQRRPLALLHQAPTPLISPLKAVVRAWRNLITTHRDLTQPGSESGKLQCELNPPPKLLTKLTLLAKAIAHYMADHRLDADWQSLLFETLSFCALLQSFGDHSRLILSLQKTSNRRGIKAGNATLRLENLLPADHLRERFQTAKRSILFSATLAPARYYQDLLGLPDTTVWRDIGSPFRARQLELRIVNHIDTRFQSRDSSIAPINARIHQQYTQRPGNYLVYLSSFDYLNKLHADFTARFPEIPAIAQFPGMGSDQRRHFIETLESRRDTIAFAVLGGAFSEGIDLPGEQLLGAFIATLGLPPHNDFHRAVEQLMDSRFGDGYRYTYLYPGLRKVIQAAGRVIRSPDDQGLVELIDPRFSRQEVREILPGWWFEP